LGVELQHLSTLKKRPIEVRSNEIQAKKTLKIKKIGMQYMDFKANGKHLKLFEIKMAWWLVPLLSPKEMKIQSP